MGQSDDKLRVLSLGPFFVRGEGARSLAQVGELNQRLARRGHCIHWFVGPPGVPEGDLQGGVNVHRLDPRHSRSIYRLYRALGKRINRLLDDGGIDLIHIHDPLFGFLAFRNPRLSRLPVVTEYRRDGYDPAGFEGFPAALFRWRRFGEQRCLKRSKSILFSSRYSRDVFLKSYSIRNPRLREISPGVDVEKAYTPLGESCEDARAALGLPGAGSFFITVDVEGALEGLENVILGMSMAAGAPPGESFGLLVLGEEPPKSEITALVHRLGMKEQIHFLGPVVSGAWPRYLQLADVFLLPAPCPEAVEREALKALAAGAPVFAPPDTGVAEVVRKIDESLVFWRDTPEAVASAVKPVLKQPDDLRALQTRCREAALEFSWDVVLDRLEEEYLVLTRKTRS
jgi:glycosyltransferase involved in cell wall biosynthesis